MTEKRQITHLHSSTSMFAHKTQTKKKKSWKHRSVQSCHPHGAMATGKLQYIYLTWINFKIQLLFFLKLFLFLNVSFRAFLTEVSSSLHSEAISSLNELAAVLHVLAVIKHGEFPRFSFLIVLKDIFFLILYLFWTLQRGSLKPVWSVQPHQSSSSFTNMQSRL